eukprot:2257363-Amphidinium_carterae.1
MIATLLMYLLRVMRKVCYCQGVLDHLLASGRKPLENDSDKCSASSLVCSGTIAAAMRSLRLLVPPFSPIVTVTVWYLRREAEGWEASLTKKKGLALVKCLPFREFFLPT